MTILTVMGIWKFLKLKNLGTWLFSNIREILLVIAILSMILQYRSRKNAALEIVRLNGNIQELTDSKAAILQQYQVTSNEMTDFIKHFSPELMRKIDSMNIKEKNIQTVYITKTNFSDSIQKQFPLDTILEAIKMGISDPGKTINITAPILDKGPCHLIEGYVSFDGQKLKLNIENRQFFSVNEVVAHVKRRQWKLLGIIPTRLFGKRELKITVFNSCGETETIILQNIKGKWKERT